MKWYFYVGIIAAICIAIYMMPQLIKLIKTKDTASISVLMVGLAVVGDLFFVINGIGVMADPVQVQAGTNLSAGLPLFLANLFGLIISAIILFFKIRSMIWAKKFNIKEDQIPNHYKEIKSSLSKARAEKAAKKAAEQQKKEIDDVKKQTPVSSDSESVIG